MAAACCFESGGGCEVFVGEEKKREEEMAEAKGF
jgi:hypothetical protein